MTREEAIKELEEDKALYMPKEWIENIDRDTPDGRLITALEMAIKALEREQKWIPVSERLPEESDKYIVSALDGTDRRTTVAPYQPRCKAWTMTGRMAYWRVIAWMPLPEPYKAEREVENG